MKGIGQTILDLFVTGCITFTVGYAILSIPQL